jgi:hypothetical protein
VKSQSPPWPRSLARIPGPSEARSSSLKPNGLAKRASRGLWTVGDVEPKELAKALQQVPQELDLAFPPPKQACICCHCEPSRSLHQSPVLPPLWLWPTHDWQAGLQRRSAVKGLTADAGLGSAPCAWNRQALRGPFRAESHAGT